MDGINRAILGGNLGQQPELRYTQSGKPVLSLRMATNERFKNSEGEWKDRTEWHTVVVWGKRAEGLVKVLQKGSPLLVEGRIQTRQFEDKQHVKRYVTEIVAQDIHLLGRTQGQQQGETPPPPGDDDAEGTGSSDAGSDELPPISDADIPG